MKASGCCAKNKGCQFPNDPLADIQPLDVFKYLLIYQIEWNNYYRNAPYEAPRKRIVCIMCTIQVQAYLADLIGESAAIDSYYERRENVHRTASQADAKYQASGGISDGYRGDRKATA